MLSRATIEWSENSLNPSRFFRPMTLSARSFIWAFPRFRRSGLCLFATGGWLTPSSWFTLRTDSQPRSNSGLCPEPRSLSAGRYRWSMKSSELAPLLFTVYLAAASGRSPALPCFAAFLALVCFSGLFAFTQLFFQTRAKWLYDHNYDVGLLSPHRKPGLSYFQTSCDGYC